MPVVASVIIGAVFGFVSEMLANALTKKAPAGRRPPDCRSRGSRKPAVPADFAKPPRACAGRLSFAWARLSDSRLLSQPY